MIDDKIIPMAENDIDMPLEKIDIMIEDAIKKCQTHGHLVKSTAGDLRNNGFDGELCGQLIRECEMALKYAHAYQAYINTLAWEE